MKKPLTRLAMKPLEKGGGGLKRLSMRQPLNFVGGAENPLKDVPRDLTPEEDFKAKMNALGQGLGGAIKKQAEAHKERGRVDFYTVICFEHSDQVDAFLKAVKYPVPDDQFIDGMILADIMGIELPPTPYRAKALRKPDANLARLVTVIPKRLKSLGA